MSPPATQPSPAEKGWQCAGSHSSTDCASAPVRLPTRRRRAMPRGGELCWKMSFLTAFAVLCVCVSHWGRGERGAEAVLQPQPPESIHKVVQGCSGCFLLLISPNKCSRATSTCNAGEAVSSHPNKPSPPKPGPGRNVGLSYTNYKIVSLWGLFVPLILPIPGPRRIGGGCSRLVPWASSLPK